MRTPSNQAATSRAILGALVIATLETAATPLLIDLAINLVAWWAALVASRSLHERNRAEQVQWHGMEALRVLAERLHAASAAEPADASTIDGSSWSR